MTVISLHVTIFDCCMGGRPKVYMLSQRRSYWADQTHTAICGRASHLSRILECELLTLFNK